MLNITPNKSISYIHKDRMRYRGPIESLKINNFKISLGRDIIKLSSELNNCRNNMVQYMSETLLGSKMKVSIMEGDNVLFEGADNTPIENILSDNHVDADLTT